MHITNQLSDNLWEVNASLCILGCEIGHRMTVVGLRDGALWLHSPVEWSAELGGQLEQLGTVKWIVAPSVMHDLFLGPYTRQFRDAEFYGARGLAQRLPWIPFEEFPEVSPWEGELDYLQVGGMPKINEVVFCHRPSRTLIVADLLFNLRVEQNVWGRLVMRMNGIYRRTGASRLFRSFIRDQAAFRASLDRILEWDFDRIVMGHGEVIDTGGKEVLRKAY